MAGNERSRIGRASIGIQLRELHPKNRHIRPKIRQQLQVLRDKGVLRFLKRGFYRLVGDNDHYYRSVIMVRMYDLPFYAGEDIKEEDPEECFCDEWKEVKEIAQSNGSKAKQHAALAG